MTLPRFSPFSCLTSFSKYIRQAVKLWPRLLSISFLQGPFPLLAPSRSSLLSLAHLLYDLKNKKTDRRLPRSYFSTKYDSTSVDLPAPATFAKRSAAPPFKHPWIARLVDDVDSTYAYIPLLACCTVSGLCDSVAFNASGTFVSMQTGNTIFLALGASKLPVGSGRLWLKSLVSILSFWTGCYLFSLLRHFRAQRKVMLFFTCFVQVCFIVVAAALGQTHAVEAFGDEHLDPNDNQAARLKAEGKSIAMLPIALLAFQFGGQIVMSRVVGFDEIPTNVLTSLYCDLLSDPRLLVGPTQNAKRNRRIGAFVMTMLGGITGGWLQRSWAGMGAAMWIAAGIKLMVAVAWLLLPGGQPSCGEM